MCTRDIVFSGPEVAERDSKKISGTIIKKDKRKNVKCSNNLEGASTKGLSLSV